MKATHVAVIAFPFGSHPAALLSVARALAAAAPPAATVSFFTTADSLPSPTFLPANLRLVAIPDGSSCSSALRESAAPAAPGAEIERRIEVFLAACASGELSKAVRLADGPAVGCVVSDAFMWIAAEVAAELAVRWIPVWPGATCALLAHLNTDLLRETIGVGDEALCRSDESVHSINGLSCHRINDLPEGIVSGDLNSTISRLLHKMSHILPRSHTIALNTFSKLDPPIDSSLSTIFKEYLPIGPFHRLIPHAESDTVSDLNSCLAWLSRHEDRTVVYVSFGTVAMPPPHELCELALGLESSCIPFLWSLKETAWELLPPGFLERTKSRGLLVNWAPQVEILQNKAVGLIVTHGGWNTVLEAITAGVPMACRPFFGDHCMIARSISDIWKVGVSFEGAVMTKDGVVKTLNMLMKGGEGRERILENVCWLRDEVMKAFESNGSSMESFARFAKIVFHE